MGIGIPPPPPNRPLSDWGKDWKWDIDLSDPDRAYKIAYYCARWDTGFEDYNIALTTRNPEANEAWLAGLAEGSIIREFKEEQKKNG